MNSTFRVVFDTNVIISAQSNNPASPNRELIDRWIKKEFQCLYSTDTLLEYVEKLLAIGLPRTAIRQFIINLRKKADHIYIEYYHFPKEHYPDDPDDIAFVLCAENGKATHLVTYDSDLFEVQQYHSFKFCSPVDFLKELRSHQAENGAQ